MYIALLRDERACHFVGHLVLWFYVVVVFFFFFFIFFVVTEEGCDISLWSTLKIFAFEPEHNKTNKIMCVLSEDSAQPRHPSSLIRVIVVRFIGS